MSNENPEMGTVFQAPATEPAKDQASTIKLLKLKSRTVEKPLPPDAPDGTKPETEVVSAKPPTFDGEIRISGHRPIYVPSLEEQRSGFTPYFIKVREDGKDIVPFEFDLDSGPLAARVLLGQYHETYVQFKEKGA